MELIAKSGSSIAHCPKSNAKFGHGYAPFEAFLDNGIAVGLGSDSVASNNVCDSWKNRDLHHSQPEIEQAANDLSRQKKCLKPQRLAAPKPSASIIHRYSRTRQTSRPHRRLAHPRRTATDQRHPYGSGLRIKRPRCAHDNGRRKCDLHRFRVRSPHVSKPEVRTACVSGRPVPQIEKPRHPPRLFHSEVSKSDGKVIIVMGTLVGTIPKPVRMVEGGGLRVGKTRVSLDSVIQLFRKAWMPMRSNSTTTHCLSQKFTRP